MSCGHDGCTCPPDQPASGSHLAMVEDRTSSDDGHDGHHCGGHGDSGCCGQHRHPA